MAVYTIRLHRGKEEIGEIKFDLKSKKSGAGEIQSIRIPSDLILETQLWNVLNENPDALVIVGGISPPNLGQYSDGVFVAIKSLSKQFNYTFNASDIPWPQISGDVR